MPTERRSVPAKEYEEMLKKIKDVLSARIVQDEHGGIVEVHILAGPGRSVKYIARDVESTIIAAFGSPIDRRRISIAQLGGSEIGHQEKRLKLERVQIVSEDGSAEVNVHLKMSTISAVGSSRGMPTQKAWLFLASNATLSAISQFLTADVNFHVEDASISVSRGNRIALVTIMAFVAGRQELLTGSCPVAQDDREAVVKATLSAINRRFNQLLVGN